MASSFLVGILLLVISLAAGAYSTYCQSEEAELKRYLLQYDINIDSVHDTENSMKLTLTRPQLIGYCRAYDSLASCMTDYVIPSSEGVVRAALRGQVEAMRYFCHESFDEFTENYQTCMAEESVRSGIKSCSRRAAGYLKYADSTDDICQDLEEGEDCEIRVVRTHCGKDASKWFANLLHKYSKYVKDFEDCDSNAGALAGIVIGVVIGVMVAFGICACICRLSRHVRTVRVPPPTETETPAPANATAGAWYPEVVVTSDTKKLVPGDDALVAM